MHKIHSKPFSMDDFSHDHMTPDTLEFMNQMVEYFRKRCVPLSGDEEQGRLVRYDPAASIQL